MIVVGRCELSSWVEGRALDVFGEPVGVVVDIFTDASTGRPTWLAISTEMPEQSLAVAPVRGSSLLGEDVVLAYDRDTVATAPSVRVVHSIDPADHTVLSDHYSRRPATRQSRRSIT